MLSFNSLLSFFSCLEHIYDSQLLVVLVVLLTKSSLGRKGFVLQLPGPSQVSEHDGKVRNLEVRWSRLWEERRSPACSACFLLPPRTTCPGHCSQWTSFPTSTMCQENAPQVCLPVNLMEAFLKVLPSQMIMFVSSWQKLASRHVYQVSVCLPVSVYHWGHFQPLRRTLTLSFYALLSCTFSFLCSCSFFCWKCTFKVMWQLWKTVFS